MAKWIQKQALYVLSQGHIPRDPETESERMEKIFLIGDKSEKT